MTEPFPLRLTPFERLMYFSERSDCPNVLGVRLSFDGRVDRAAAEAAALHAATRHPLCCAAVDPHSGSFVLANSPESRFGWLDAPSEAAIAKIPAIDPHREGGRLWLATGEPGRTELIFLTHHAMLDGLGGLQIVGDWMREYDRLIGGRRAARTAGPDPRLLLRRDQLGLTESAFLRRAPFQAVALYGGWKFLVHRVAPLVAASAREPAPGARETAPAGFGELLSRRLAAHAAQRLDAAARQRRVAVNDLLLSALFFAVARFRQARGGQEGGDRLRILHPLAIRTLADRRLPACNRVSLVQIDRRADQAVIGPHLIGGIAREIDCIRRWKLDRSLLIALRLMSVIPGQLRRLATAPACWGTCIFTNLAGAMDRLPWVQREGQRFSGDLRFSAAHLLAPCRAATPASLAATFLAGQWIFTLHHDPRQLDASAAGQLLDQFMDAIEEVTAWGEAV